MGRRKRAEKRRRRAEAELEARAYEAALQTPTQRFPVGADQSPDTAIDEGLKRTRDWGRYLDENSDVAHGALDEVVKGVVGSGIVVIPEPLRPDGGIDEVLGAEIMRLRKQWARAVDVTGQLSDGMAQRLMVRAWYRDGEQFLQHVSGRDRGYPFGNGEVPYRVELIESDLVPWELTNQDGWRQGLRLNEWGMPLEYAVYLRHPGDTLAGMFPGGAASAMGFDDTAMKSVFSRNMTHLKNVTRWPQTRGISKFAAVVSRLYDVKDLEESERIKNRVLASWTAAVQKSPDLIGTEDTDDHGRRFLAMAGGTVIDTLAPGETITGVGPEYPVANMPEHIRDQLRRVSVGMGVRYSSLARDYDGSYASQRQEMVESEGSYQIREDEFVSKVVADMHRRFVVSAMLDGRLPMVSDPDQLERLTNAEYRGPVTPWIDPLKEVQADATAVAEGFADIDQIRIKRGAPAHLIGQPAPAARAPVQLSLVDSEEEDAA